MLISRLTFYFFNCIAMSHAMGSHISRPTDTTKSHHLHSSLCDSREKPRPRAQLRLPLLLKSHLLVDFELFISIQISWLTKPLYLLSPRSNCLPCPKTSHAQVCLLVSFSPSAVAVVLSFTSPVAVAPPVLPAAVADAVVDAIRLFCCHF